MVPEELRVPKEPAIKEFNTILIDSIDEALLVLGEKARAAVYCYLQTKLELAKKEIPERINDFSDALDGLFGSSAARHLEILMMKCLQKQIQCSYRWEGPKWLVPDLTFTKYVRLLELWYENTQVVSEVEVAIDNGETPTQPI